VTVSNVAPTATFNAKDSVSAGNPISLSLTNPFDPSSVDSGSLQYAFDCGDGTGYGAFGSTNSRSCPTASSSSTRTVKGKIQDNDGGVSEYTASVTINPTQYTFSGFFAPVDNLPTINTANSGQTIPVKWMLTLGGQPVSDTSSVRSLQSYVIACDSLAGNPSDAIDVPTSGASGLQYLGGGNWQYNWKTLTTYARGSCRQAVLTLSDNTTHVFNVKFVK
jgi:hypothetical protein